MRFEQLQSIVEMFQKDKDKFDAYYGELLDIIKKLNRDYPMYLSQDERMFVNDILYRDLVRQFKKFDNLD